MLALRALHERFDTTEEYLKFPYKALLEKIGMQHTFVETDWRGDFILSSQVWTTSRDLARLGVLHLQEGQWQENKFYRKAGWIILVCQHRLSHRKMLRATVRSGGFITSAFQNYLTILLLPVETGAILGRYSFKEFSGGSSWL